MFRQSDWDGTGTGYNVFSTIKRFEPRRMDEMIVTDQGNPKGPKLTRRIVLCGLFVANFTLAVSISTSAADIGEKRGEIGIQLGVRWVDRDIVPDDSNGLGFAYGLEGAWAFNERWTFFGDLNFSTHDSKNFCRQTDSCNALTPESEHKVLTLGFERRFKPGPKLSLIHI